MSGCCPDPETDKVFERPKQLSTDICSFNKNLERLVYATHRTNC